MYNEAWCEVKANKEHECLYCKETIAKGEIYLRLKNLFWMIPVSAETKLHNNCLEDYCKKLSSEGVEIY